ncbi:MAG TPA: TRAP transporter small permease subunit [Casimicrobiaceae bacterium]|nr:TRAP transporter small permease subunit [Casimicrobiaceae bacterium]
MSQSSAAVATATARFRARYGKFLEWIVTILMVVLASEVTIGVLFRSLGEALSWYDEVASVLLAWLTFYGSALASVRRAHIGCPEVVDELPWQAKRAIAIVVQILVIVFFAILGGVGVAIMPTLVSDTLVSVPIPMNLAMSVIPISSILVVIAEATYLVDLVLDRGPEQIALDTSLSDGLH